MSNYTKPNTSTAYRELTFEDFNSEKPFFLKSATNDPEMIPADQYEYDNILNTILCKSVTSESVILRVTTVIDNGFYYEFFMLGHRFSEFAFFDDFVVKSEV